MWDIFLTGEAWLSLLTLTVLEIVLGIDNIIFISILSGRLPEKERHVARRLGLIGALVSRLVLLSLLSFLSHLTMVLFEVMGFAITWRAIVLFAGGLFLIYKSTKEIHHKLEGEAENSHAGQSVTLSSVIMQIMILDMVFSLDSVITAVGMTQHLSIMVIANIVALAVMLMVSGQISSFVEKHPSVKVLALSFLLMLGFILMTEAFGVHIPKGYIYFAMAFSVFVEMINIRVARGKKPVTLYEKNL